jgi:hypothetical protein
MENDRTSRQTFGSPFTELFATENLLDTPWVKSNIGIVGRFLKPFSSICGVAREE